MTESDKFRAIADWMDVHPELPGPGVSTVVFLFTKEKMLMAAKLPGARKDYDDAHLNIHVPICDGLELEYFAYRSTVCTAKTVVEEVIPAQPERIIKKVVEWECHPLLAPDES